MKKYLLLFVTACLYVCTVSAQGAEPSEAQEGSWKYAFSKEGRQNWKPEFTVRGSAGIATSGPAVTAGIRVDDKRTLGLLIGRGDTYIDDAPGDIYAIQSAAFMRRYLPMGSRGIAALYADLFAGCDWVYRVDGKYGIDPVTGTHHEEMLIDDSEGDVNFYAGIHAGVRFRIVRNVHLFLGPTLTTNTIGLHVGFGF